MTAIPFFAIRSAIYAPGAGMRCFQKVLQISGGDVALESVVPTGEILRIVLQAGERIDTGGPGIDLRSCIRKARSKAVNLSLLLLTIFCRSLNIVAKEVVSMSPVWTQTASQPKFPPFIQ